MGCDIHAYVERKIDGEWYQIHQIRPFGGIGDSYGNGDYGTGARRDYVFFAHLAGVRCYDNPEEYPKPKGIPDDVSVVVKKECAEWGLDGHSHSWDTLKDFVEKKIAIEVIRPDAIKERATLWNDYRRVVGYWFDNLCYSDENEMSKYRVVYWFDN